MAILATTTGTTTVVVVKRLETVAMAQVPLLRFADTHSLLFMQPVTAPSFEFRQWFCFVVHGWLPSVADVRFNPEPD